MKLGFLSGEFITGAAIALISVGATSLFQVAANAYKNKKLNEKNEEIARSVLTSLYSARNFILERVNFVEENDLYSEASIAQSLREVSELFDLAIAMMPRHTEHFMFCLSELKLRLIDYCVFIENYHSLGDYILEYAMRRDELLSAIEQYDLIAKNVLSFISQEELDQMQRA